MRNGITVHLRPTDRKRMRAIVDDRNSPQKHVWRARIVLATADGRGTVEIMRAAGVSKTAVWRWQARFMEAGVEGLLRDKTRPPRKGLLQVPSPALGPELPKPGVESSERFNPSGKISAAVIEGSHAGRHGNPASRGTELRPGRCPATPGNINP